MQSILEAAETAAAEIERQALDERARRSREDADRDAERTREEAVERARAARRGGRAGRGRRCSSASARWTARCGALVESLRAGAGRLAATWRRSRPSMGELYDAASGRSAPGAASVDAAAAARRRRPPQPRAAAAARRRPSRPQLAERAAQPRRAQADARRRLRRRRPTPAAVAGGGDLDGARLIALNMALNGESRADTERYLAENFQLPDRLKLIDEVYAAIEG